MFPLFSSCVHNVSDEDCNKCMKKGIVFSCPANCEYYEEVFYKKKKKNDLESEEKE